VARLSCYKVRRITKGKFVYWLDGIQIMAIADDELMLYFCATSGAFSVVIGARDDVVKSGSSLGLKCETATAKLGGM
jgi:hypothetical protein